MAHDGAGLGAVHGLNGVAYIITLEVDVACDAEGSRVGRVLRLYRGDVLDTESGAEMRGFVDRGGGVLEVVEEKVEGGELGFLGG